MIADRRGFVELSTKYLFITQVGCANFPPLWLLGFLLLENLDPLFGSNLQLLHTTQNQSVLQGSQVRINCAPPTTVNYVIWYFEPFWAHKPDSVSEIALCQPNMMCKEKHSMSTLHVHPNGTIHIKSAKAEHAGKYECTLVAGTKSTKSIYFLKVAVPPIKPIIRLANTDSNPDFYRPTETLIEGQLLELTCSTPSTYPTPRLVWKQIFSPRHPTRPNELRQLTVHSPYLNVYITPRIPRVVQSNLVLNLSWTDHQTAVRCEATNSVGVTSSKLYRLNILHAPKFRNCDYDPWIITPGWTNQLRCAFAAHPEAQIHWLGPDSQQLSVDEYISSAKVFQYIGSIDELRHKGWMINITCVAMNEMGHKQFPVRVIIHTSPIVNTNSMVHIRVGQSIQLQCDVISNPRASRVYWTFENTTIVWERNYSVGLSNPVLILEPIVANRTGTHVCVAENTVHPSGLAGENGIYKRGQSITNVVLQYPPGLPSVITYSKTELQEGEKFEIKCILNPNASGLPVPSFSWMWRPRSCKGLAPIQPTKHLRGIHVELDSATLRLESVKPSDDGMYFCRVRNEFGQATSVPVSLTVIDPHTIYVQPKHLLMTIGQMKNDELSSDDSISLRCIIRGKPPVEPKWFHDKLGPIEKNVTDSLTPHLTWKIVRSSRCIPLKTIGFTWEIESRILTNPDLSQRRNMIEMEGYYGCHADRKLIESDSLNATIQILLNYAPELQHEQYIKQTSMIMSKSTSPKFSYPYFPMNKTNFGILNDDADENESLIQSPGKINRSIACYFRAHPEIEQVRWGYLGQNLHENIECQRDVMNDPNLRCEQCSIRYPIARARILPSGIDQTSDGERINIISGQDAANEILRLNLGLPTSYAQSLAIVQLLNSPNAEFVTGFYAAHVENDLGCQVCIVELRNPSNPAKPTKLEIIQTTWDSVFLSWRDGFDGGYSQRLIFTVQLMKHDQKGSLDQHGIRQITLTNLPRIPKSHRCWLSGFNPGLEYRLTLVGENQLGQGHISESLDFRTSDLQFPNLRSYQIESVRLTLDFHTIVRFETYCFKVDQTAIGITSDWSMIHDDCPSVVQPNVERVTSKILIEECERSDVAFIQSKNVSFGQTARLNIFIGRANISTSAYQTNSPPYRYRFQTCIRQNPHWCAHVVELVRKDFHGTSFITLSNLGVVLVCVIPIASAICILLILYWFRSRLHRRKNVWIKQKSCGNKPDHSKCTNKVGAETLIYSELIGHNYTVTPTPSTPSPHAQSDEQTTTLHSSIEFDPLQISPQSTNDSNKLSPISNHQCHLFPSHSQVPLNPLVIDTANKDKPLPLQSPVRSQQHDGAAIILIPASQVVSCYTAGPGNSIPWIVHIPVQTSPHPNMHDLPRDNL